MKILHTSDWHLGHQLCKHSRREEHDLFINWLLTTIDRNDISVLIISGDIFDSGFPPNYALAQYYDFLRRLSDTCCRHAIIVGGNHDMPSTLNAPRALLKYFQIHVFGGAESEIAHQMVPIFDTDNTLEAIVCAIPFLRARELKLNHVGESYSDKDRNLIQAMTTHYNQLSEMATALKQTHNHYIPIIATGHLFTAGGKISDTERDLYIGQSKHLPANYLSKNFDYVALGHLHQFQCPRETPPIYYSGSPVPLSFNESTHDQYILMIDFNDNAPVSIQKETVPRFRSLVKMKGHLKKIQWELTNFSAHAPYDLAPWVEIHIRDETPSPELHEKITAFCEAPAFELLKVICKPPSMQTVDFQSQKLHDLSPLDVFEKRCEAGNISGDAYETLISTFKELLFLCEDENAL
ncbi:MAG: exonuclease SbcCD subunit D C-terminal domain-containing protein [Candidatus Magnetomorum sp.]|nr:exonuclease SbcCD subunit D C-terminal domain-containing protein [Candidatus Magnetomorum sp.]